MPQPPLMACASLAIRIVVSSGCREPHRRETPPRIVQAECVELLDLRRTHGRGELLINSLIQNGYILQESPHLPSGGRPAIVAASASIVKASTEIHRTPARTSCPGSLPLIASSIVCEPHRPRQLAGQFDARRARHLQVGQHDLRQRALRLLQTVAAPHLPKSAASTAYPCLRQQKREHFPADSIIIDHQDPDPRCTVIHVGKEYQLKRYSSTPYLRWRYSSCHGPAGRSEAANTGSEVAAELGCAVGSGRSAGAGTGRAAPAVAILQPRSRCHHRPAPRKPSPRPHRTFLCQRQPPPRASLENRIGSQSLQPHRNLSHCSSAHAGF